MQENDLSAISFHENIQQSDNELTMARKVFDSNLTTLTDTRKLLQEEDLKQAVQMIDSAKRLFFFGVGGSEIVAADAYHKFLRSPISVVHSADYHIQLMEAALLTPEDCALLISHTGKSKETIELCASRQRLRRQSYRYYQSRSISASQIRGCRIYFCFRRDRISFRSSCFQNLSTKYHRFALCDF